MSPAGEPMFAPDSVTRRVHADPVLWLAGLRALMLQALHPAAMAGVLEHSDFRGDPWGRLRRTADFVGTLTFGTQAAAERAGRRVQALHAQVSGVDRVTGRPYRADDPDLLRWVHCCEVDSFLSVYRRSGGRLTDADADTYLREQTRAAGVVGLEPSAVPSSRTALATYFERVRPQLQADRRARDLIRYVLVPPMPGATWLTPARPAWAGAAALAFTLLPRWARQLYGLPGLPMTDLAATVEVRALGAALRALPATIREGPHQRAARDREGAAVA